MENVTSLDHMERGEEKGPNAKISQVVSAERLTSFSRYLPNHVSGFLFFSVIFSLFLFSSCLSYLLYLCGCSRADFLRLLRLYLYLSSLSLRFSLSFFLSTSLLFSPCSLFCFSLLCSVSLFPFSHSLIVRGRELSPPSLVSPSLVYLSWLNPPCGWAFQ